VRDRPSSNRYAASPASSRQDAHCYTSFAARAPQITRFHPAADDIRNGAQDARSILPQRDCLPPSASQLWGALRAQMAKGYVQPGILGFMMTSAAGRGFRAFMVVGNTTSNPFLCAATSVWFVIAVYRYKKLRSFGDFLYGLQMRPYPSLWRWVCKVYIALRGR
jgi:hypothetical protein